MLGPWPLWVADPVCARGEPLLGYPEVAVVIVPTGKPRRGRRELIPECGSPEARQKIGIRAVDDELECDAHAEQRARAV